MSPAHIEPDNLRIHVAHYSHFTERRAHMESLIRKHGLDRFRVQWMLLHDREAIWDDFQNGRYGDTSRIAASSLSLILKHLAIYHAAAVEDEKWHLVLEDDLLIKSTDFLADLQKCLFELPDDWELLFIGEGCDLHVPWWRRRLGKRVYFRGWKPWWRAGGGTSRCTEAYLVNPSFAKRFIVSRFAHPPFDCPIDWLLAKAGYDMHIRSYWAEPPLAGQGAFESWTKNPHLNELLK